MASLRPSTVRTGARLLVGGYGLRVLDADTGTARQAAGMPASAQQPVTTVVSARDRVYALSTTCDGTAGRIYRVDDGAARPVAGPPATDLVGGAGRVWAVEQPHPAGRLVLRLVEGARSVALPART